MLKIHLKEILKGTKLHSSYSTSLLFFRRGFIQTLSVTLSWNKIFLLKFKYIISVILITLTMFRLQIYDNQCLNCKTTQERIYIHAIFNIENILSRYKRNWHLWNFLNVHVWTNFISGPHHTKENLTSLVQEHGFK